MAGHWPASAGRSGALMAGARPPVNRAKRLYDSPQLAVQIEPPRHLPRVFVAFCRRTISAIQTGANGGVQPGDAG